MVTGDNLDTARAIAIQSGILDANDRNKFACMEGKDFREYCGGLKSLTDENGRVKDSIGNKNRFKEVQAQLKVLARSTPDDKYMLVTGLKENG